MLLSSSLCRTGCAATSRSCYACMATAHAHLVHVPAASVSRMHKQQKYPAFRYDNNIASVRVQHRSSRPARCSSRTPGSLRHRPGFYSRCNRRSVQPRDACNCPLRICCLLRCAWTCCYKFAMLREFPCPSCAEATSQAHSCTRQQGSAAPAITGTAGPEGL